MRKITFKNPNDTLYCGGQVIHQGNITPEKFDELVAIAPGHADHFIVTEVSDKPEKESKTPKDSKPTDDKIG
jgi:hypothetical protein